MEEVPLAEVVSLPLSPMGVQDHWQTANPHGPTKIRLSADDGRRRRRELGAEELTPQ